MVNVTAVSHIQKMTKLDRIWKFSAIIFAVLKCFTEGLYAKNSSVTITVGTHVPTQYSRDQLYYFKQFSADPFNTGTDQVKRTAISSDLYHRLKLLNICSVQPTIRGCRAGTRLKHPIVKMHPTTREAVNKQPGVNWNNLINIECIDNNKCVINLQTVLSIHL